MGRGFDRGVSTFTPLSYIPVWDSYSVLVTSHRVVTTLDLNRLVCSVDSRNRGWIFLFISSVYLGLQFKF